MLRSWPRSCRNFSNGAACAPSMLATRCASTYARMNKVPDGEGDQWGRPVGLQIVGRHRGDAPGRGAVRGRNGLAQRGEPESGFDNCRRTPGRRQRGQGGCGDVHDGYNQEIDSVEKGWFGETLFAACDFFR